MEEIDEPNNSIKGDGKKPPRLMQALSHLVMIHKRHLLKKFPKASIIILFVLVMSACSVEANEMDIQEKELTTIVEEEHFQVTMPGDWAKISEPDPFIYFNSNDKEAFTVTLFGRYPEDNDVDRLEEFQKLAEIRQQAEKEINESSITISEISFAEQDGTYIARFTATNKVDFHSATLILGLENFIALFFYEGHGVDEIVFSRNTRTIMNSIIIY